MSLADLTRAQHKRPDAGPELAEVLRRARRGALMWVKVLDYDHLHATAGHRSAESLLRAVHAALTEVCRPGDTVIPLGQGNFAVVAARVSTLRAAQGLAARLLGTLEGPLTDEGQHVQTSLGACFFPSDGREAADVLHKAELSAVHAQRVRRQVQFYEPTLDADATSARILRRELLHGLQLDAFHVVYQPQFCLRTHRLLGAEALARFTAETLGPVGPSRFVPMLEQLGRADELTDIVLRVVAHDVAAWHHLAPAHFRFSVNLSGSELYRGRAAAILDGLAEAGAPPDRFTFEVTESVWMHAVDVALEEMQTLRAAGARLALDDFGSGYSSLSHLAKLPVDQVKMDDSFVRDVHQKNVRTLLDGVVRMVHALDMPVLVEGVETPEQLAVARNVGADVVQGFLTAVPEDREHLERRLWAAASTDDSASAQVETRVAVDEKADAIPQLPILPSVLDALCRLRSDDLDPEALVALAESDPLVATFVLQLCRAGPNPPEKVPSISRAVLRVGARQILERLLAGTTTRVFLPDATTADLWHHAILVACWAAAVAGTCSSEVPPERAYTAGLLHDLGRFLMLDEQPLELLHIERGGWSTPSELLQLEHQVMEADHATLGGLAARARQLPADLCDVLELHHAPLRSVQSAFKELIAVVQVADVLAVHHAHHAQLRTSGPVARAMKLKGLLAPLRAPLTLDHDALAALWCDVEDDAERRASILRLRRR